MIRIFNNLEKSKVNIKNNNDLSFGAKITKVWVVYQKIIKLYLTFSQKNIVKVYEPDKTFQIIQEFVSKYKKHKP